MKHFLHEILFLAINADLNLCLSPQHRRNVKFLDLCLFLLLLAFLLLAVSYCVFCIIFPESPVSIFGIIPESLPKIYSLPLYIFYFYFTLTLHASVYIVLAAVFIWGTLVIPLVISELRIGHRRHLKQLINRAIPKRLRLVYRSVQILQQMVNKLCGKFILPTQTLSTLLFIWSGFMAIRHRQQMETTTLILMVGWASAAVLMWGGTLVLAGNLHSSGKKILNSWKNHQQIWTMAAERKMMNKFRVSCKPIYLGFGKTYIVQRKTVMIYGRELWRGIVRALLML